MTACLGTSPPVVLWFGFCFVLLRWSLISYVVNAGLKLRILLLSSSAGVAQLVFCYATLVWKQGTQWFKEHVISQGPSQRL